MNIVLAPNLGAPDTVRHGFFGRAGGVSTGIYESLNCGGRDSRDHILENRHRAVTALAPQADLVTLDQLHGTKTVTVTAPWQFGSAPGADSMVTSLPGIALGILAADCVPILFADRRARVVGAAHAGWKGALAGVIESTLRAMEALGAQRGSIASAIGPCISQASYEVSAAFRDEFLKLSGSTGRFFVDGARPHHFQFDLESFVAWRLDEASIANVWRAGLCTYARESEYFSYRRATHRNEKDYGRQVSAILLCK